MEKVMESKLKVPFNGMMDTQKICFVSQIIFLKEMEARTFKALGLP